MNFLNKYKDWHLNRNSNQNISFICFHSYDTSLNELFDNLLSYLNSDIKIFNFIYPSEFKKSYLKRGFDLENFIANINKKYPLFGISLNNDSSDLSINNASISRGNFVVTNFCLSTLGFNNLKQIPYNYELLLLPNKLYFASFFENDYIAWQGNKNILNYKFRKGLNYIRNKNGKKEVDISKRPGRTVYAKYFNYCGASKMWFGPLIYQFIPQELILGFKGAIEIKILKNNITFVHLYEGVYDGDEPHNQEVQQRFRDHIGIDKLIVD